MKTEYLAVSSFILVGFVIYINSLDVPFYFDDAANIMHPALQIENLSVDTIIKAGQEGFLKKRPISNISFAFNYFLGEYNVHGYHIFNIIVHICNAILLFFFLKTTLELPVNRDKYVRSVQLAWLTALIWLAHPLATQSVTYIVQRMNSMAAMFYILSMLSYIYGRKKHLTGCLRDAWGWYIGCFISGLLAMGSKEIALTLPFFIFLYEWYFFQELNLPWIRKKIPWIGAIIFCGLVFAYVYLNGHPLYSFVHGCDKRYFTLSERLLTETRVVMHYIGLLLYPNPYRMVFDYNFTLSKSLFAPPTTFLSLASITIFLLAAVVIAKREKLLSFCLLWFFGNLIIESSVICLEIAYEHRTYLPSMLLLFFFIALVYRLGKSRMAVSVFLIVISIILGYWTIQRNIVWQDPVRFWEDNVMKNSDKPRLLNNLGAAYAEEGKPDRAKQLFARTIELFPEYATSYNNLGALLVREDRVDEAEPYFVQAITLKPDYVNAHLNLSSVYLEKDQLEEAIKEYRKTLEIIPDPLLMKNITALVNKKLGYALVRSNRPKEGLPYLEKSLKMKPEDAILHFYNGEALMYLGRLNEAIVQMRQAVQLDDHLAAAHYNLALLITMQKGPEEEALLHYKRAEIYNPSPIPLLYNLGNLLFRMNRLEEAEKYYTRFLQISPELADAHNNLGLILIKQGKYESAIREFQAALGINPKHQLAGKNLQLLQEEIQESKKRQQ